MIQKLRFVKSSGAAVLAVVCMVAGCGDRVLEASNATIKNGRFYRDGEDKPFTGKVTNVPEAAVLPREATIALLTPLRNLTKDGGLQQRVIFFAGSICDVQVKEGMPQGEMVCKYPETEFKRWSMTFRDGRLQGEVAFFGPPPENRQLITARFSDGAQDGRYEVFSAATGKRILQDTFKAGVPDGEETGWDESTGNVTGKGTYVAGKLDGPLVRYAPDGKTVIYRTTLVAGLHNGVEEEFHLTTGKPKRRVEWKNGKQDGAYQAWDESGALIADEIYRDGVPIFSVSQGRSADVTGVQYCVGLWASAFRSSKGDDAAVTNDQSAEWEHRCREGKSPLTN